MGFDFRALANSFAPHRNFENEVAEFYTAVPWVAPLAYLNILYKPLPAERVSVHASRLKLPASLVDFYSRHNGVKLLSGAVSIGGIHEPGTLLPRSNVFSIPPYNVENMNLENRRRKSLFTFGSYSGDGAVGMYRSD